MLPDLSRPLLAATLVLGFGLAAGGMTATGQDNATVSPPTPEQVTAGKRIWADAACYNCHGNNGQGGNSKDFPKGPNLRTSLLDYATTLEIIACGLPGTQMPAWARGAYTERGCFGDDPGPAPEGTHVVGVYDEQQLADLMAYISATFHKGALE